MLVPWMGVAYTQVSDPIRGPITALYQEGDHLFIGQQATLIEAQITDTDVRVIRTLKLNRHEIRAFAVNQNVALVLSEDGLTTLDANLNILDFVQGGGQRLAVSGDRVYVAALEAGVRVLRLGTSGKLEKLGALTTIGPAADVAAEVNGLLWVAESVQGVRLYDTRNLTTPIALSWLRDLAPATVVRVSGPRLYVGYGNHIALVDTINLKGPKLLSALALDDKQATVGDMAIQGSHLYIGRLNKAGPDMVSFDVSNPKAALAESSVGNNGAGERLALSANNLFIGSVQVGLQRISLGADRPSLVATWEATNKDDCTIKPPGDPQPPNLGEAPHSAVTLKWSTTCHPVSYEVRINGQVAGTTHDPSYSFTPQGGLISWQVTAIDGSGSRAAGPTWHFEVTDDGWLTAPAAPPNASPVYAPPLVLVDSRSPAAIIATTCAAIIVGLLLIVGAAWFFGSRAEERTLRKDL